MSGFYSDEKNHFEFEKNIYIYNFKIANIVAFFFYKTLHNRIESLKKVLYKDV